MEKKIYSFNLSVTRFSNIIKGFALAVAVFCSSAAYAQPGEALSFDGTNDYVELPFGLTASYTKEAWINASVAISPTPNILTGSQTALYINNGALAAGHVTGGFVNVVAPASSFPFGVWTHVAVTYDANTGTMVLYQNGVPIASGTAAAHTEAVMRIGTLNFGSFFNGNIDEVRIWNYARSGAEILAGMTCALSGDEPFLQAYYNFNQGVAGGNNATVTTLTDVQDECSPDHGTLFNFALTGATSNWVAPGATILTTCISSYENIGVSGNSLCIENGDVTPSLLDHTNFGDFGSTAVTRTFTITNSGNDDLTITSVTITGTDAADFSTTAPATTIPANTSSTFMVTFNPATSVGVKNATIEINNSDDDEALFTFNISGNNRGPGTALQFSGIDDYVNLGFSTQGSYTKEVWINTSALGIIQNLITGTATALYINNGRLAAGHATGGFGQILDPVQILPNTWYHVAVTYNAGTGALTLYKNGVVVGTAAGVANDTETNLLLGRYQGGYYNGIMDEVRVWNTVRTITEINASMNCELSGDEAGLLGYYKFNQGAAGGNNTAITNIEDSRDVCVPNDVPLINFSRTGTTGNFVAGSIITTECVTAIANISVSGNGNCISDSDATPSTGDFTDFGTVGTNSSANRTFIITNTGTGTLNLTGTPVVQISGANASEFSITSMPNAVIAPGATTTFTLTFSPTSNGIKNATITILNDDTDEGTFTFEVTGSAETVVPVTLVNFVGAMNGSAVRLQWETTNELNFKGFEVFRSNGAQSAWEFVGYVEAVNQNSGGIYNLVDYVPLNGINTYRLRMVDLDGSARLSNTVSVNNNVRSSLISVYPNPFQESVHIVFNDEKLLNTIATVRTATGSIVSQIRLNNYRQLINLRNLSKGMYIISLANGEVLRVVKQ